MSEGVYFPDAGIVLTDRDLSQVAPSHSLPNPAWDFKKQVRTNLAAVLKEESDKPPPDVPKYRTIDDPWRPSLDEFAD